jgi:hypothetical protein
MSTKHKYHDGEKHAKPRVNLEKQRVYFDSEVYEWDEDDLGENEWHRISSSWVRRDGKKVRFIEEKDRPAIDVDDEYGREIDWKDVKYRVKDRSLVRYLDHQVERAKRKKKRRKREAASRKKEELREEVLRREKSELEHPKQDPANSEIKRDKHGVRLYSNDGRHFFTIGVYRSRKEPGSSTVCLFVAGRPYIYTLGNRKMDALFKEVTRTFSRKDLSRLVER